MVAILIMSAKLATLGPLKIKVYWNKGYDVTNKITSSDSNYDSNLYMWSSDQSLTTLVYMRKVIITSIL